MLVPDNSLQAIDYLTALDIPPTATAGADAANATFVERRVTVERSDGASPKTPYGRRLNDVGQEWRRVLEYT